MHRKSLGILAAAIQSVVVLVAAPALAASTSGAEVVAVRMAQVPTAPDDAAWEHAPVFSAALVQQDMVEPRLLQPSSDKVDVRAVTDGRTIVFRLEWTDSTKDDLPGLGKFSDACAVQLPVTSGPDVPAPQMGEAQRPVEITYWRAFWQSTVDGREDSINALFPNATVDHYPFEAASLEKGSTAQQEMAKRYAPARALGNDMAGPRDRPVQDLVAEGPGTIRPAAKQTSDGRGVRTKAGWRVVLSRTVPAGLEAGQRTQVAFAVWEGTHQESGSRKMRSVWFPLLLQK
ncbi:MAG TPA: ethylbenzene dehydrogenase-related protein [Candidatus Kryptonia bacterium]|nr:ethylbenzene dehydrogenase-related protein [Candidatus Kryptonia bacterium]